MPGVCRYSKKVAEDYPWTQAVPDDPHSFMCKICNSVVPLKKGIRYNVERHRDENKNHLNALKLAGEINTSKQKPLVQLMKPKNSSESVLKDNIMRAEVVL